MRGGRLYTIIADVCAFTNTNGGTLFLGLSSDSHKAVVGVPNPEQSSVQLEKEIATRISPPIACAIDVHETAGKKVLRVLIPRGDDPPYVVDDYKIYVRTEAETSLAMRDELVSLVLRGQSERLPVTAPSEPPSEVVPPVAQPPVLETGADAAPHTGVEVVLMEEREGTRYFTVRDLRNGNVVKNVTQKSARRLWHYALTKYTDLPSDITQACMQWNGNFGLLCREKHGQLERYDFVQITPQGNRYFFGVTEDGIHGAWRALIGQEEE